MATSLPDRVNTPGRRERRVLLLVLGALMVLAALSWGAAHLPLGAFQTPFALGVAGIKALIVGYFFMELRHAGLLPRFIALLTVLFIALLSLGIVGDALFR